MRLHALIHKSPPLHNAGAEHFFHAMAKWLVARGHEVSATVAHADGEWELDGVCYVGEARPSEGPIHHADILLTHLDQTRIAAWHATRNRKPLVHLLHNHNQLNFHRVKLSEAQLVVFNSCWLQRAVRWQGPTIVCRPPVFAKDYRVKRTGDACVLVNLSEAKGGRLFWELARAEPQRRFIGVLGAYGEQIVPKDIPGNVEVWENRADARDFYREARVILMPSDYESWGRVAVEAAASGIPTIAHATPGLLEALGPAAMFCDRNQPADWQWVLRKLDDPRHYDDARQEALWRSAVLDPVSDLERLEAMLIETATRGYHVTKVDPYRARRR